MIKLLIVDDEEEIRKGIISTIPWEENDIKICGEAENGIKALEIIEETEPDIMLIDIRMPLMDGLTTIKEAKDRGYNTVSVILSGHDNFYDLQKALRYRTFDYLLKPCKPEDILNTILKVKEKLENENENNERLEFLKKQFIDNLPMIKQRLFQKIIVENALSWDNVMEELSLYNITLSKGPFIVTAIKIDNQIDVFNDMKTSDVEMIKFSISKLAEELLVDEARIKSEVFENGDETIIISDLEDEEKYDSFTDALYRIKNIFHGIFNITISIGVGNITSKANELHLSYSQAVQSLDFCFFIGTDSLVRFSEIETFPSYGAKYPLDSENELLKYLQKDDINNISVHVDNFLEQARKELQDKKQFINCINALLFSLYHLCIEKNINTDSIFGNDLNILYEISNTDTFEMIKDKLISILEILSEKLSENKPYNMLMENILNYIDLNISSKLSLEIVSQNVYLSPGYLSQLFKKNLGINFLEYIHKVRIEKSCELLKDISLKVYEVASAVGYSDEKHFSQIFKKYTGYTPTQYRDTL